MLRKDLTKIDTNWSFNVNLFVCLNEMKVIMAAALHDGITSFAHQKTVFKDDFSSICGPVTINNFQRFKLHQSIYLIVLIFPLFVGFQKVLQRSRERNPQRDTMINVLHALDKLIWIFVLKGRENTQVRGSRVNLCSPIFFSWESFAHTFFFKLPL